MPRKITRGSVPAVRAPKPIKVNKKRAQNAFAIAAEETAERPRIGKRRLADLEESAQASKRRRGDDDAEEDEAVDSHEDVRPNRYKRRDREPYDDADVEEHSDSDGNTWRVGYVDEEDDSDIDSDEAFEEGDEEKFEGFTFRGSSNGQDKKDKKRPQSAAEEDEGIDLDEDDIGGDDEDEDSFGDEGVDLATMLDDDADEDAPPEEQGPDREDEGSFGFGSDDEEDDDPSKAAKLQDLISSIQPEEKQKAAFSVDVHESKAPSVAGVTAKRKLELSDLMSMNAVPRLKQSLKVLTKPSKPTSSGGIPGKLSAPLPRRQQDRLDRIAANEKAKETLKRWVDTVKHNRRAEHLSFPLRYSDEHEARGTKQLISVGESAPMNDLESSIQKILQESGLASSSGRDAEEELAAAEELQTNKLPLEEVEARRAELRKQRELLFREEVRAKRVKKIKSKAYRRVHRKEREKLAQSEREVREADGVDVSEEERELNDRRRAEARASLKHRNSKWAKGVKDSGRAAWDEDARDAVTDMARRKEELRTRIQGKTVRLSDDEGSEPSEDSEDESGNDEEDETTRLQRRLNRISGTVENDTSGSKLGQMAFMRRAEAAREAQNKEDIERIRHELAVADGDEAGADVEEEDDTAGPISRKTFGPTETRPAPVPTQRQEFEEASASEQEWEDDEQPSNTTAAQKQPLPMRKTAKTALLRPRENTIVAGEPSVVAKQDAETLAHDDADETPPQLSAKPSAIESTAPSDGNGWTLVTYDNDNDNAGGKNNDEDDASSDEVDLSKFAVSNQELAAKAFAGDMVVEDFKKEKARQVEDEDDKIIDNALPGWGSWAGAGLSKREKKAQKAQKGKYLTKIEGVKAGNRRDAKLDKVIINEKRVKKNTKYMASTLPFPFESKEQYERSLRLPKGQEWSTRQTYREGTRPRVEARQGIIKPLERPLV